MPTQTINLEVNLAATNYLVTGGWTPRAETVTDGYEKWALYHAEKPGYPTQRAIDVTELVRRCDWQERHRLVPAKERTGSK